MTNITGGCMGKRVINRKVVYKIMINSPRMLCVTIACNVVVRNRGLMIKNIVAKCMGDIRV